MKRIAGRLAALLLGLLLAAGVAELAVRVIRPGLYEISHFETLDGHRASDLSAVLTAFDKSAQPAGAQGLTALAPGLVLRGCYDRPRWDYFDENGCVEYRINSLGLRDDEFPLTRPDGEYRVLAIGDSFTFGLGVAAQDAWPAALERLLTAERGSAVQVINAGFAAGHLPSLYEPWILDEGLTLDPQLVIVGLCLNDLGDIPMLAYDFEHEQLQSGSALIDWIWRLRGKRAVRQALELQRTDPTSAKRYDFARKVAAEPGVWNSTQAALVRTQRRLAERGIPLVLAVFPMLSQLSSDYPFAGLHQLVADFCQQQGIERVDLAGAFLGRNELDFWAHPTDQHPNDRGQALLARGILDHLRGRDP